MAPTWLNLWSGLLLGGALFGLLYSILSLVVLVVSFRRKLPDTNPAFAPPITVFKPLKGLDEDLPRNLESFFHQNYPSYELVFGVNDLDDPATGVVRKLIAKYPESRAKLVIDTRRAGLNPKVNSLCNMARYANYDHWVISDSNIRVDSDYLSGIVQSMQDQRVGLVTSLIRGVGGERLGAKLENLHLNSFIAAGVVTVTRLTGIPASIGKSMLLRREIITRLGGFETFADCLLEDGLIGRNIRELGYRTEISMHAVENVNHAYGVRDFTARHGRWALMRRHLNLAHFVMEIFSYPVLFALAAAIAAPSVLTATIASAIVLLKTAVDILTVRTVGGDISLASIPLLPAKDLLLSAVWARTFFTNRVSWRGNHFRIGAMTKITLVPPHSGFSFFAATRRTGVIRRKYNYAVEWLSARVLGL